MSAKPKALVTRYFAGDATPLREVFDVDVHDDTVPLGPDELGRRMSDATVVISYGDRIGERELSQASQLRLIADFWGGGSVDLEAAARHGVTVAGAGGADWIVWSEAEHAIALLLAVARRIPEADRFVRAGSWTRQEQSVRELRGSGIHGKTIGIVNGARRAGLETVRRLQGWDARILHSGEVRSETIEAAGAEFAERDALLRESDFVLVLHGDFSDPGYVISERELSLMKPEAILVSITIGRAIDENALVRALRGGRLRGAGLDKLERQPEPAEGLLDRDDVVVTPHADGALDAERAAMFAELVDASLAVVRGESPRHAVTGGA